MIQILFIVNPISGTSSKHKVIGAILSYINMKKYKVTVCFTAYSGHASELAEEAVRKGVDIVVAVGGDGTVNEVARSLIYTHTSLGIIPCGSGNGLARHLHIPMNIRKAIEIINEGTTDTIDTMNINGIPCFCTAGVGYDAMVSAEYAKESKRGLFTYVRKAIKCWAGYKGEEYVIKTDSKICKRSAISITCANANQWGNGFHVAPKASVRDGIIDVTIITPIRIIDAIPMSMQILGYSFDKNPNVECVKSKQISIKLKKKINFHVDGEALGIDNSFLITVKPRSLKVLFRDLDNKL